LIVLNLFMFYLDVTINTTNCAMATPIINENITCSVSVRRIGTGTYQFPIVLDFGNGVAQNVTLKNTDANPLTVTFQTQYQTSGNYSVVFKVPNANQTWALNQLQISGISLIYLTYFQIHSL